MGQKLIDLFSIKCSSHTASKNKCFFASELSEVWEIKRTTDLSITGISGDFYGMWVIVVCVVGFHHMWLRTWERRAARCPERHTQTNPDSWETGRHNQSSSNPYLPGNSVCVTGEISQLSEKAHGYSHTGRKRQIHNFNIHICEP